MERLLVSTAGSTTESRPTTVANPLPSSEVNHLLPHFIRAEANFLRLPLFALHTKRLKALDGIECTGRITRNGETNQFRFRATRNTATLYPGPLARDIHVAFLDILTEQGRPLQNPITWRWRDLCRRMRIEYSGRTLLQLKGAVLSTAGLLIHSEYALYSKPDSRPICTREDALHLYERVAFIGSQLPDASVAETNHLWLSEWYLNNLNAMFTAPLDYSLWQYLNQQSPIASRLYEFLLINFYSDAPVLRINYQTLAMFLPIRSERFRSDAHRQLDPVFELLTSSGVLAEATWTESKQGLAQLHLYRGRLLSRIDAGQEGAACSLEDLPEIIAVRELRNLKLPESEIVADFYRLWLGTEGYRATEKEKAQAKRLVTEFGQAKAKALIALAVKQMRQQWPEAKTFGAVMKYLPDAVRIHETQHKQSQRDRESRARERNEDREITEAATRRASWKPVWESLTDQERETIRQEVLRQSHPRTQLDKMPRLLEGLCIDELARHADQKAKQAKKSVDAGESASNVGV